MEEFPFNIMWNLWVLMKVSFFAWEAFQGRILFMDQLKRRGWSLPSRCFMYKAEEESTNRLLLHDPKATMIWQLIFALFGVQWVMSFSIKDSLLSWCGSFVGKTRKKAWNATSLCFFWSLWWKRNIRAFEDTELTDQAILWSFLYMLFGLGQG